MQYFASGMIEDQKDIQHLEAQRGDGEQSIAHEQSRWFRRNGSQLVEGDRGFLGFTMYLRTEALRKAWIAFFGGTGVHL